MAFLGIGGSTHNLHANSLMTRFRDQGGLSGSRINWVKGAPRQPLRPTDPPPCFSLRPHLVMLVPKTLVGFVRMVTMLLNPKP